MKGHPNSYFNEPLWKSNAEHKGSQTLRSICVCDLKNMSIDGVSWTHLYESNNTI